MEYLSTASAGFAGSRHGGQARVVAVDYASVLDCAWKPSASIQSTSTVIFRASQPTDIKGEFERRTYFSHFPRDFLAPLSKRIFSTHDFSWMDGDTTFFGFPNFRDSVSCRPGWSTLSLPVGEHS